MNATTTSLRRDADKQQEVLSLIEEGRKECKGWIDYCMQFPVTMGTPADMPLEEATAMHFRIIRDGLHRRLAKFGAALSALDHECRIVDAANALECIMEDETEAAKQYVDDFFASDKAEDAMTAAQMRLESRTGVWG